MASKSPILAVVVPCFNEEKCVDSTIKTLLGILDGLVRQNLLSQQSFLYFVDDGSTDETWKIICGQHLSDARIRGLKLSRNFGHQIALLAGLEEVVGECDVAISIDADLQQDPYAIPEFLAKYSAGADVVLGLRNDRSADSWFKKSTANSFYAFMRIMGVNLIPNHADYRLLSKRALEALLKFPEPNIFLRGTCLLLGFNVDTVKFEVGKRQYGETKYSLSRMFGLAIHGITSFSIVPLRMVAVIGFLMFGLSVIMSGFVLWHSLIIGDAIPGWASTILPIYFLGGIQLFCMGIIGEYVGQIYTTVKSRPRWISESKLD